MKKSLSTRCQGEYGLVLFRKAERDAVGTAYRKSDPLLDQAICQLGRRHLAGLNEYDAGLQVAKEKGLFDENGLIKLDQKNREKKVREKYREKYRGKKMSRRVKRAKPAKASPIVVEMDAMR